MMVSRISGLAQVIDQFIDDGIVADINIFPARHFLGLGIGPHIEADYHRIGGTGQIDIGFRDTAHPAMQQPGGNLVVAQIFHR